MVAHNNDNQAAILEEALTRFVDECLQSRTPDTNEFARQYPQCEEQLKERIQDLREIDFLLDSLVQADDSEFVGTAVAHDLVGQKLASFQVEKVIGRGGMGVVYLARDSKLERSVAIKSLPSRLLSSSSAKSRFKREAKLLASFNHPNIAGIYDIIEHDAGHAYLILEYVPGQTLSERIAREPLNQEEAFSIGQQIAEAIAAAHDKGVIHRDLKPGNIKITPEGKVKVLDFGLAKTSMSEVRSDEITVTQPGRIMGTPAYMSPEQARGRDTDHRTDIWSFGCVMYEMITGHLPFEGETATDTIAKILERQPDWQTLPQEIPTNIQTLLRRCLEKDPNKRLRDIGDAAIEIKETLTLPTTATASRPAAPVKSLSRRVIAVGFVVVALVVLLTVIRLKPSGVSTGQINSLAVLPLRNLTGDTEQKYFVEGLTEELINDLGKMGVLQVRSRTSIMQYQDAKKPLPEIARELNNVDAVVEGSVMRLGQQVRIAAQLIHAPTDTQLWAQTYERNQSDIEVLFNEIARTIIEEIGIALTPEQEARLTAKSPINPEAYDLYLKGMFHLHQETPEETKMGLDYLHEAIDHDPTHPMAYGALALGYVISTHGPGAPSDAFERANEYAQKALKLDQNQAEAHAALAMYKVYREWDWEGAKRAYQKMLELNPNLLLPRAHYSWYLLLYNRKDDALAEMRKIHETDPLMPLWPAYIGWQYLWAEQYDQALIEIDKTLELTPNFPMALYVKGCALAKQGIYEQAIELHEKAGQLSPEWKCGLAHTYVLAGQLDEARKALAELEADYTSWDRWFIGIIYAALDEKDEAFKWLEKAYDPPNHPYLPWIKYAPEFKSLRGDPRFDDLLRRMNLLQ